MGIYTLQEISLTDSTGNNIRYLRNGTTSMNPGRIAGTHPITLSTMDLNVDQVPSAVRGWRPHGQRQHGRLLQSAYRARDTHDAGFAAAQKIGAGWGNFLTVFSPRDFSGDGKNDVMAVSKDGGMYLYRGNGRGGFAAAGQRIGNGWGGFLAAFSTGDFTGDHKTDVMSVNPAGDLLLYRGNGRGGWAAGAQRIGWGWAGYR